MLVTNSADYLESIALLYLESYAGGTSAQFIDPVGMRNYLTGALSCGYAHLIFENEFLIACLLYTPLSFDTDCPMTIRNAFRLDKCAYITEVMVAETYRGQGIGRVLLRSFFEKIDTEKYTDAFIRVWDENVPALKLYEKSGFRKVAEIRQEKIKPDGKSRFVMNKLYLHKSITKMP